MRLVDNMPQNENFKVYFDSFFGSIQLLAEIKNKEFYALGGLKTNRMEGAVFMSKSKMKKEGVRTMDTRVSKDKNIRIVRWQSNNRVNIAFTLVGYDDKDKVKCSNKKEKKHIEGDWPEAITYYNHYMGSADLMDCQISYYSMTFRTKHWPARVILYLFTMSVAMHVLSIVNKNERKPWKEVKF